MRFQYTHLQDDAIRVLRFSPYARPDSIHVWLEHLPDFQNPVAAHYSIIAYPLIKSDDQDDDDFAERRAITLNGRSFLISASLYRALSTLVANGDTNDVFWTENISINHANSHEQSQRESMRVRALIHADRILIWSEDSFSQLNMDDGLRALRECDVTCPCASLGECMQGQAHRIQPAEDEVATIDKLAAASNEVISRCGLFSPTNEHGEALKNRVTILMEGTTLAVAAIAHYQHAFANASAGLSHI